MTDFVSAPAAGPEEGNLLTPVNSSSFSKFLIENLPAYRKGLEPQTRGLEIGMAHGYLLFGPFAKLGPLRDSTTIAPELAGLVGAVGLVLILTITLSLYAYSQPRKDDWLGGENGWAQFASGFIVGGGGGAATAYFLTTNLSLLMAAHI
ncbi:Photosystem I reaction centre subunit XI [Synechococcus sp. PCC 7502]|uniref:photosystem I reaction center subunit XI n=1 Tax=Synechococcus sp. PCC 7502 TaxID=1173263 RepID=UPI00029FEDB8|nr:photosystem I reaction center subunit XI [Synechococcus sp. PCC 7502]AFY74890.1 Photosystem I reaction centre subunit XI [Synechococcus sp. PCC 7502]